MQMASRANNNSNSDNNNNSRPPSPNQSDGSNICPICRGPITSLSTTNCNHRFCRTCIHRWTSRNATCPSCRQTITEIRNTMPNGLIEVIQISRAELMANRVNETYSTLMLLFTILSHTLLPEVSNYLEQLNEIARDLNVPTTLSRLRDAANEAVVAAVTRAQATGATGAGGPGATGGRSASPTSSLITMTSRSGSAASSTDGSGGTGGTGTGGQLTGRSGATAGGSAAGLSRTALLIGQLPMSPTREDPLDGAPVRTGRNRSSSSSAPTLRRVMGTIGSSSSANQRRRSPAGRSASRSPSPSGPRRQESRASKVAAAMAASAHLRAGSRTPPPSPAANATTTPTGTRGAVPRQLLSPRASSTPAPGDARPPTPDEVRRALDQRQQDIRHLTESFNKVNQVYEVLMIMHMVVHRNQVELEAPPGDNQRSSSESSD